VNSHRIYGFRGAGWAGAALLLFSIPGLAQQSPPSASTDATSIGELEHQVRELRTLIEAMRVENAESRAEMQKLRADLQATRALLEKPPATGATAAALETTAVAPAPAGTTTPAGAQASASLEDRVEKLEESTSLIGSKVDEQYETKVETASKYRARLHGIILMNAFRNIGSSDSLDLPTYAEPVPRGWPVANVGATLRQSEVGLEIFGPTLAGAKTSADVQLDLAGGFPDTGNGVNFGLVRLQTASLRLDWQHTSVVAGQDALFLSPLSPTSFASLALPPFAFAGNLWAWTPQLRVEHRFSVSDQQTITLQAGVFDNLNWQFPDNQFNRTPQAGELSGQPAYGFRTAWSRPVKDQPLSFGAAGYYGRQNWTWGRYVDAWAGMADWEIPLLPRLELSGEFYRGVGIGGLGAAVGTSIVYGGNPRLPFSPIRGVDTAGGWAQLKFRLTSKLELNGAVSEDDAFTGNIRGFATDADNYGLIIGRNRGALANLVFRPRSDLILAGELRRLRTFPVYNGSSMVNQASVSAGVLF
jgi:hypothetical protein